VYKAVACFSRSHLVLDFCRFPNILIIAFLSVHTYFKMLSFLFNASVIGLGLVATVNGDGPDISGVSVASYSHGGSACPQGSTAFSISVDAKR
jgi:hypothetical protein